MSVCTCICRVSEEAQASCSLACGNSAWLMDLGDEKRDGAMQARRSTEITCGSRYTTLTKQVDGHASAGKLVDPCRQ